LSNVLVHAAVFRPLQWIVVRILAAMIGAGVGSTILGLPRAQSAAA